MLKTNETSFYYMCATNWLILMIISVMVLSIVTNNIDKM